jgi:hypothetical protein
MWFLTDILGLFSNNVGPFSRNVVPSGPLFSSIVGLKWAMFLGQPIYVLGPLQLRLSWTHFIELIRIDDPLKRAFYEVQCLQGNWSIRQLQRQIGSLLYERTGLSADKESVIGRATSQAKPLTWVQRRSNSYN